MKKKNALTCIMVAIIIVAGTLFLVNKVTLKNSADEKGYRTYRNDVYHYQLSYPAYLLADVRDYSNINFKGDDGYGYMNVRVETTAFTDIEKWAESHIREMEPDRCVVGVKIDKRMLIDKSKAISFFTNYSKDCEIDYDGNIGVFFIKNGALYTLNARKVDQEKIWNSFRFNNKLFEIRFG